MAEPESTALVPLEERAVDFYGDQVLAVRVEVDGREQVYVPLRPICDYLGLNPASQIRRVRQDPVMGRSLTGAVIMTAPGGRGGGGPQTLMCLPLKYLPGWLFGITASRVRPELREKVIRYQEECFEVLWQAFQQERRPPDVPVAFTPDVVWSLSHFLTDLARWQIELERRIRRLEDQASPSGRSPAGSHRDKPEP